MIRVSEGQLSISSWVNGSISKEVIAVETATVSDSEVYKVLVKSTGTFGSGDSASTDINYETVNIDKTTNQVNWGTLTYTDDPIKLEETFTLDLNGDNEVSEISANAAIEVSTDKTGAKLAATTDGSLFIKDGNSTISIISIDGNYVSFDLTESWTDGTQNASRTKQAYAVEAVDSNSNGTTDSYTLVVQDSVTYGDSLFTDYEVYSISTSGLLNSSDISYFNSADLDESVFDQDITGDGTSVRFNKVRSITNIICDSPTIRIIYWLWAEGIICFN